MSTASVQRRARLSGALAAQVAAAAPSANPKFEITELRLFSIREPVSRRAYSVVRVRTRGGLTGFGEGPTVPAAQFSTVQQFWLGKSATAYATSAPALPLSGAVDMALLDIIGKACQAPVCRVLGGPTRNKVRAMASLSGSTPDENVASLKRVAAAGFHAYTVPAPSPSARNMGQAYERDLRKLVDALRSAGGEKMDFVLDGGARLTPGDAANVAMTLEPLHPLWFDEPVAIANTRTIRKIADESVVPLGFGRDITDPSVYQELLRESLIDVVRPDISREGISRCRRIAALAEPYYVAVAPHHEGGPIASAAAIHLAASLPNFFIQHFPFPEAADMQMRMELAGASVERVHDGFAALPSGPGLGIQLNESVLEKYHAA